MTASQETAPAGRRRAVRWRLGALLLVLGVWGAAVVASALSARDHLEASQDGFSRAQRGLGDRDLAVARAGLREGEEAATAALSRLDDPQLVPLGWMPWVGDNLHAVQELSRRAAGVGEAAAAVLDTAESIVDGDGATETAPRPEPKAGLLDQLQRIGDPLAGLAAELEDGVHAVESLRSPVLVAPVSRAVDRFLDVAGPRVDGVQLGADAAAVLPSFLGADEPRRYLVFASALSELRSGGGLLGSWSILTVDEGSFDFAEFGDVESLGVLPADAQAPDRSFRERYAHYGALRDLRNALMSPHVPWGAEAAVEIWEELQGESVDGVLVMGPSTIEALVEELGSLQVPGVTTLDEGNTLDFIGLEAYAAFEDDEERKRVLGAVATAAFERLFAVLEDDALRAGELFQALVRQGSLAVWTPDEQVQSVVERAGAAGTLPRTEGEVAGVYVNNLAGNKVDWFTGRAVEHDVWLRPDGRTRSHVTVRFRNDAPTDGYPRRVLGPWVPGLEPGDNLSLVTFYCGPTCSVLSPGAGVVAGGAERGLAAWDATVRIDAGEERVLEYATSTGGAWRRVGDRVHLGVTHLRQPTLADSDLRVRVHLPAGWEVDELPAEVSRDGDVLVWTGSGSAASALELHLVLTARSDV